MRRFRLTSEWVLVAAAAVIMFIILFMKPLVGVADNGDFLRVMITGGINYMDDGESFQDRYFGFFHSKYAYVPFSTGGYVSSQIIFIVLAGLIGRVVHPEFFDIRLLSALSALLMLSALYVIMRYNKSKSMIINLVFLAVLLFIFLDVAYMAYFNSFFGEAITLIFMLLTFALALAIVRSDGEPSMKLLTLFYVSALFLIGTKLQNSPIGLLLLVVGLRFWTLRQDRVWRKRIVVWSSVLLLFTVGMYVAAPKELKHINLYQTVFYGILKDSPHVDKDLKELGLPQELKANAGTNFFQGDTVYKQNDPLIQKYVYNRLGHKDVGLYYLKHPSRLLQKMERAAANGMSIRAYYLGNYEKAEGKKSGALSFAYSGWSEFKNTKLPKSLAFLAVVYAAYYAVLAAEYVRRKADARRQVMLEIFAAIGLIGIFAFLIPLIGDGEADLGKHLFLFNVCFDMMLVSGVIYVTSKVVQLIQHATNRRAAASRQ
ncbi:hypothetical protein ACFO9Q_18690 [Paenibacillus sp. GCM10023252]|uniref:glycan biosynthesis hexose transferase WsfD n=1 Tax=Paenibacillus sp. GCM10023252 TaxID=3252649 RepID=UPI00361FFFA1